MAPKRGRPSDEGTIPAKMAKKTRTIDQVEHPQKPQKKHDNSIYETPGIVATADAAADVDADPPHEQLMKARTRHKKNVPRMPGGAAVVYWMRMEDLRIIDNRALEGASKRAAELGAPLIVLFVFSPGDYKAHDRSPRRIDFVLRNLAILKESLGQLHIPLHTVIHPQRKLIADKVVDLMRDWAVKDLYINIEYPVDELRRDIRLLELATDAGIHCELYHDRCLLPPGAVLTQKGKMSSVYTPFMKQWATIIQSNSEHLAEAGKPQANDTSIHENNIFHQLFLTPIPDLIPGFECDDSEKMSELWPAGSDAALQTLDGFLGTKSRTSQVGDKSVLEPGEEEASLKASRIGVYEDQRARIDMDSSSRLSPYLAAGVLSARHCMRRIMELRGNHMFDSSKGSGPGVWVQEIGWRDFYIHIMAAFPRVSMGRPFLEKYADVFWEEDIDGGAFQAWKEGKTGYPIVDAAMRQCQTQGWMHNRGRMIAAMFLVKDLMLDWRLGERHFMRNFIDGDLAANNGGWQWCASTGTDAQPYFRIFNPLLQSEKADPNGDFIRHFVPELRHLEGKALHDPFNNMSQDAFKKLGYPKPIVDHKIARDRAIRRFKNVGEE